MLQQKLDNTRRAHVLARHMQWRLAVLLQSKMPKKKKTIKDRKKKKKKKKVTRKKESKKESRKEVEVEENQTNENNVGIGLNATDQAADGVDVEPGGD